MSTIVRAAVARELGLERPSDPPEATRPATTQNLKVLIRLSSAEALQLAAGARESELSRSAYVAALIGGGYQRCVNVADHRYLWVVKAEGMQVSREPVLRRLHERAMERGAHRENQSPLSTALLGQICCALYGSLAA